MSTIKPAITRLLAASLGAALLLVTPGFDAAAQARGSHKADLSVAAGSTATASVGQTFPLSYTVNNAGPADATGVTVTIAIPAQLRLDTSQSGCTVTGSTATCGVSGTLPAGYGVGAFLWLTAVAPGAAELTFTVRADQRDPALSNNTTTTLVTIGVSADVSVSMSPATVTAGQPFFFSVSVGNAGPSPAENISTVVQWPAGLSLVSGCTPVSPTSCALSMASLPAPAGAIALLQFVAAAPGTYTVQASVSAGTPDPNLANNTSTAMITAV
jgi:uncharacterized repeat protein (TIGR01451 family)